MNVALYNMNFDVLGGGERRTCALAAHLAANHKVTLFVQAPVSTATIKSAFGLDLANVEIVALAQKNYAAEIAARRPHLFINNTHCNDLPNPARRGIYMCMFPELERIDLSSYQVITANSGFTAEWVRKRWGYASEIVYSACQDMGPPAAKKKVILNVARFFADAPTAHHKRQNILLDAFKALVDRGLRGWELHLVGMVGPSSADRAYVEQLRGAATGYPVQIRPAVDFEALREAYRRSPVYWHATGFGTSEALQPSKQEHFGMAVVEAMSAGAVPVAYNGGGPRELIDHGANGYLWNGLTELSALTLRLIEQPTLLNSMAAAAMVSSGHYQTDVFLARMDHIIERLPRRSLLGWIWSSRAKPALARIVRLLGLR